MADLYAILGVPRDATPDDVKRAYRRKARELHPDAGGDEESFKQLTLAYEVLSDADRRARYDRYGMEGLRATAASDPFDVAGFGSFADLIDAFFGGGFGAPPRTSSTRPGRDVLLLIELELEDVVAGTKREVTVEAAVPCDACAGTGSRSGSTVQCATCDGRGQVRRVVRSAFGQLATARPCPDCGGSGRTLAEPCPQCRGEGRRDERRALTVDVPPGVDTGDRLRVSGVGEAGRRGGSSGDLYVEIRVRPHELFARDGRDLSCDVTVPFVHAALGATLQVPTIDGGTAPLELPAGSQPGDVLLVRGAGLPRTGGGDRGDLRVRVHVEVPRVLSAEEEQLLRSFATLRGEEAPPAGRGLFRRLREAFR